MEPVESVRVRAVSGSDGSEREESVVVEEPLAIRVRPEGGDGFLFTTSMRTPGNDRELAAGLLFSEGVIAGTEDLVDLDLSDRPGAPREERGNSVVATLRPDALGRAEKLRRGSVVSSACGVCGRTSVAAVARSAAPRPDGVRIAARVFHALPGRLRARQSIFAATGGLHAAGLFSSDGAPGEIREDIGRHNAVDKLVGAHLLRGELPLSASVLMVSGRAGFEILEKACAAGIPVVASVSAPSSLAVDLAESAGITLVGFLREGRFNVYAHAERILLAD